MKSQNEIRQSITDRIVEALKQGKIIPWRRPFTEVPDPVRLPTNYSSNRAYSGINILALWLSQQERGFPISYWASFQQWKALGAVVKKGEKATQIVFYRQVRKTVEQENGEKRVEAFPLMRTWSVFNIAQVEGEVAEKFKPKLHNEGVETFPAVDRTGFDRLIAAIGADIRFWHGQRAAYYRPPHDFITMPDENQFVSFPAMAETLLHELAHFSEAEGRTGWTGSYSEGELRAEIASCFLMAALGIPGGDLTNHAAYVQSWLQALENDPKHIFKAAAAASKASDYLLGFVRPKESAVEAEEEAAVSA
jgi:antirestriction protein ArdC